MPYHKEYKLIREQVERLIATARAQGLHTFTHPVRCKRCGTYERFVSDRGCIECATRRAAAKKGPSKPQESISVTVARYRKGHITLAGPGWSKPKPKPEPDDDSE
jgi:hypothetical protein